MTLQAIAAAPTDTSLDALSEPVQAALKQLRVSRPPEWMVGVQPVDGYRLGLFHLQLDAPDPLTTLNALLAQYGLDWTIIGLMEADSPTVYKSPWPDIVPYLIEEWQYDEDGQQIPGTNTKPTRVPHSWAGFVPWPESS